MNWQPIDSAPKDGTRIRVSDGTDEAVGWWTTAPQDNKPIDGVYLVDGWAIEDGPFWLEPTQWMPL